VFIDGKAYGKTRLDIELPVGIHTIRIEKSGYTSYEKKIDLKETQTVWAKLKETTFQYIVKVQDINTDESIFNAQVIIEVLNRAPLYVHTDSNGFARVFIDENRIDEPGRLRVEAKGYEISEREIDLVQGRLPQKIHLTIESPAKEMKGNVFDDETGIPVPGATISIDGAPGSTTTDNRGFFRLSTNISASRDVRLTITKKGYELYSRHYPIGESPIRINISKNIPQQTETREGTLLVYTVPSEATVMLGDGREYYKGMSLPPGEYKIIISAKGYEKKEKLVTLKSGKAEPVTVKLKMIDISRPISPTF
jgi:hypothetical protein